MAKDNDQKFSEWEQRIRRIVAEDKGEDLPEDADKAVADFWKDTIANTPIKLPPKWEDPGSADVDYLRSKINEALAIPPDLIQATASDNMLGSALENFLPTAMNKVVSEAWLKKVVSDELEKINEENADIIIQKFEVAPLSDYSTRDIEFSLKYSALESNPFGQEIEVSLGPSDDDDAGG